MVTILTVQEAVAALKPKAIDQFSSWVIDGAERALADNDNPLRLNFFSTAMRILFEHIMDTLAPNDKVIRSCWFERKEGDSNKPKRTERIKFAIQGGLSEVFVREELKLNTVPLRSRLLGTVD